MKLKQKHWEIGNHFLRFVDRYRFPDFKMDREELECFIRFESYGKTKLSDLELKLIQPLLLAKADKEITLQLLFQEMGDWWSHGKGWYYPIAHTIQCELARPNRDRFYIKSLIKIMRSCYEDFIDTLSSFTGLTQEQKNKYFETYTGQS